MLVLSYDTEKAPTKHCAEVEPSVRPPPALESIPAAAVEQQHLCCAQPGGRMHLEFYTNSCNPRLAFLSSVCFSNTTLVSIQNQTFWWVRLSKLTPKKHPTKKKLIKQCDYKLFILREQIKKNEISYVKMQSE